MTARPVDDEAVRRAAVRLREGGLVVYPTETVYGLGADATDPEAIERVFAAKGRDREQPLSMAVPDLDAAAPYVDLTDRERAFAEAFLPGPVTLVAARTDRVPDTLVAGGDRVGIRVPDHDVPRRLAAAAERPVTSTSANLSGEGSARTVDGVSGSIRADAVVLDGGETPGGTGSTVVDVSAGVVHREGAAHEAVARWLAEHG
ncbi:threonylcarbamoyl-AMP synthase [Haloglomus irregulare]|jgi:L-threonylcarbamoyladenylate synthase|uniref:L-threonylcarbamoyladenylate synthase n=1 Tax=Haloglomus irregulare TaxID=2234134 RepID=A0A554MWL6_9EURY|nr:L-threonylcarbamoyladenylate synthase [Haloglomus irregulare]TSD09514.1 threonylcarbamoyl-AMP synthase [Haloglomus irregulare]